MKCFQKYFLLQQCSVVFFLTLILTSNAYGQSYLNLAGITYSYEQPFNDIDKPKYNTINQINAFLNAPLKIKKDYLMLSPSMQLYDVRFGDYKTSYRSAQFSVSWLHQWKNERWNTAFVAIAQSNALKTNWFEQNTFQAGGAIVNTFTKNEDFKIKFGVYGNAEFFGPYFLPLLGVDWNINERLGLYGLLPSYLFLEYKIVPDKFHGKISFDTELVSYRNQPMNYFRVNDNHVKMVFDFYLTKNIVLSAEAGHSVLRKFVAGVRRNGKASESDLNYRDAFLVRAGLYFRVSTESKN